MMKKYFKAILLFLVLLLTMLLSTKVQATTTITEEKAQQMLDMIPDSIEIDLKEIENINNQAEELIKENVHNIWTKNEINMDEIKELENQYKIRVFNVGTDGGYQYSSINDFYEAKITIDVNGVLKEKKVKIVYSNHKNYNTNDEQYVKNYKIENKKYFETDLKFASLRNFEKRLDQFLKMINQYYESLFNDKDITVLTSLGAGASMELNELIGIPDDEFGSCAIMIFKNDVLYDLRYIGTPASIPVITVPYNIDDTEISSYALNQIKTTFGTSYDTSNLSIKKGVSESVDGSEYIDKNIPNIYTVYDNAKGNNYPFGWLIINKEEVITSTDKETNIQFKAPKDVVPENTVLEAKVINDETTLNQIRVSLQDISTKYVTYDITLKSNNVVIQPQNGKVQVSIPIPDDFDKNNLVVYRIEPNGNKIAYEIKLKSIDGQDYAVFETDHFSNYVLAEKVIDTTLQQDSTMNKEHILDNEPKTGVTNNLIFIVGTITIIGIILIKKYL